MPTRTASTLSILSTLSVAALTCLGIASASPAVAAPDRCAKLDQFGNPADCLPVLEVDAAWWDGPVCCAEGRCVETDASGHCGETHRLEYCRYAELEADGSLTCQFVPPDYCDSFPCLGADSIDAADIGSGDLLCCYEEGCYDPVGGFCGGLWYSCSSVATNDDGTIACVEGKPAN